MRLILQVVLLLLLASVNGCTTMLNRECADRDWHQIGKRDGMDGKSLEELDKHKDECGGRRVRKNREAYMAGREQGLALYCTSKRGYREGVLGQPYHDVCPEGRAKDFLYGYHLGEQVYAVVRQQDVVREKLNVVEEKLRGAPEGAEWARLMDKRDRLAAEESRLAEELERLERQSDELIGAREDQ